MAIRRRAEGRLTIEQPQDRELVRATLAAAAMITDGLDWAPACYLAAWLGAELVGVVGIEPRVDAALIRSLLVVEPLRGRGIGAELIRAARKAAHTRGARTVYALSAAAGDYLKRFGFEQIPLAELVSALRGAPQVDYYAARPAELARETAWRLDISADGVIPR